MTTDGYRPYLQAVAEMFADRCDYAMLIKQYGGTNREAKARYSPAEFTGSTKVAISGNPDMKLVSTSHVERQNLTMRMSIRRLTRLTNGFSKKIDNHRAAIALHFAHYNFCRIHQTLRVTTAMEPGITAKVWTIAELVA